MKTFPYSIRKTPMTKNVFLLAFTIFAFMATMQTAYSQNGVYIAPTTGTANASAMLEIYSTNKGLLIPRIADWTSNPSSPATGLLIYNLVGDGTNGPGFYYYNGSSWVRFGSVASVTAGNGLSGGVITGSGTIAIANGGVTNAMLANQSLTVIAGTGLSGGGSVSLGGTVTLTNAGVTSLIAGTGISVSSSTGGVTINNTGVTSVSGTLPIVSSGGTTPAISLQGTAGGVVYGTGSGSAVSAAGTGGQVLTSGGAGAPTWTTPATGTINGSGTTNYLTKWNPANTTLSNSQIFDNGTNIGIRTASPTNTDVNIVGSNPATTDYSALRIQKSSNSSGIYDKIISVELTPGSFYPRTKGIYIDMGNPTVDGDQAALYATQSRNEDQTFTVYSELARADDYTTYAIGTAVQGSASGTNWNYVPNWQGSNTNFLLGGDFSSSFTGQPGTDNSFPTNLMLLAGTRTTLGGAISTPSYPANFVATALYASDNASGSATHWAGYFVGNVNVTGTVTAPTFIGNLSGNATNITGIVAPGNGGTGVSNTGTITNAANTTITGGGTLALGGYTFTVPATGTAALGTGSANYVSKWTNANTLSTSLIYDDGTNVGIGATSPGSKLYVTASLAGPINEENRAAVCGINTSTNGSYPNAIGVLGEASTSYGYAGYFKGNVYTTGTETATTFNGALNGNASTATKLQTGRTISITGDLAYTSPAFDGSGNITAAGTLANSGVTAATYGSATTVPQIAVDAKGRITSASNVTISGVAPSSGSGYYIQNGSSLQTSASFNIDGNGYVAGKIGVGTTSPGSMIDAVSSGVDYVRAYKDASNYAALRNDGVLYAYRAGNVLAIDGNYGGSGGPISLSASGSYMRLTANVGTYPNQFVLATNGNVGIGTANPIAPLDFGATVGNKIFLYPSSTSASYGFGIASSLLQMFTYSNATDIAFGYGSSTSFYELMRIKGSGNVGIGTAGPLASLHIIGSPYTDIYKTQLVVADNEAYNTSPAAGIIFQNKYTSGGAYAGMGGIAVGKENTTDGDYASYLSLYTRPASGSNTERMRITSTGYVGLGTAAPLARLTIWDNTSDESQMIRLGYNSTSDYRIYRERSSGTLIIQGTQTGNNNFSFKNAAGTVLFRILENGNVGIGNTIPGYPLDVSGAVNLTGTLNVSGSSGTAGQVLTSNGSSAPSWSAVPGGTAVFTTSGNWTVPTGIHAIVVEAWGGGGGGGASGAFTGGSYNYYSGGGGAGGGGAYGKMILTSIPTGGTSIPIVVGAAGTGGTGGSGVGGTGVVGGASQYNGITIANGGNGGLGGSTQGSSPTAGGGGAGGTVTVSATTAYILATAGIAGTAGSGQTGSTSPGIPNNAPSYNSTAYGKGGSGANGICTMPNPTNGTNGSPGSAGLVIITYW